MLELNFSETVAHFRLDHYRPSACKRAHRKVTSVRAQELNPLCVFLLRAFSRRAPCFAQGRRRIIYFFIVFARKRENNCSSCADRTQGARFYFIYIGEEEEAFTAVSLLLRAHVAIFCLTPSIILNSSRGIKNQKFLCEAYEFNLFFIMSQNYELEISLQIN